MKVRVYVEASKRFFACAYDWPGWCRTAKTEELALEALAAYAPRYAVVAREAGLRFNAPKVSFEVEERLPGTVTTDFGAPDKRAVGDFDALTRRQGERLGSILEAAWALLDRTAARAPNALAKGPRGGGRDRDPMVQHVLSAEHSYARAIGVRLPEPKVGDDKSIDALRTAIVEVFRAGAPAFDPSAKGWPLRYAARRMAWHVLDHAWEMEDKGGLVPETG